MIAGETPDDYAGTSLMHTLDGGLSWTRSGLGQSFPASVAESPDGVLVAAGPAIWRSGDHGATWARLNGNGDHALYDVTFVDRTQGWAVGQRADTLDWSASDAGFGAMLRTSDGARWEEQTIAPGPSLNAVTFATAQYGWAVGESGRVLRTLDWGSSWQEAPSAGPFSLTDVFAVDGLRAWVLGRTDEWESLVMSTNDGGRSWSRTALPRRDDVQSLWFVSPTHGWIAGAVADATDAGEPLLLETTDGGATWTARSAGRRGFARVTFVDEQHGWLLQEGVDNRGSVLRTTDGGVSWQEAPLPGPSSASAADIAFADQDHGWVAGDRIWETQDGGVTWTMSGAQVAPWFMDWTLNAVAAEPGGAVWAVGGGGRILSTVDTAADTAAPQTVDDGDRVWHRDDVTVSLTAADVGGGQVASTQYRVDGESAWHEGSSVRFEAPADHFGDGVHLLRYRSTDEAGNVERTRICRVLIDTASPWAGPGDDVAVRRGRVATLRYDLEDNLSPRSFVVVRVYKAFSSKLVRTIAAGLQGNGHRSVRFPCRLRRGWYRWIVTPTDLAGNEFEPWVGSYLEVR